MTIKKKTVSIKNLYANYVAKTYISKLIKMKKPKNPFNPDDRLPEPENLLKKGSSKETFRKSFIKSEEETYFFLIFFSKNN